MSNLKLPSDIFNQEWESRHTTTPVVILIGGYAGTGKSTLANQLAAKLSHMQIIPTGIFRSIAQAQTDPRDNDALFLSTYDLGDVYGSTADDIFRAYKEQCAPVTSIIQSVIDFQASEKQHLIIEGNHIVPWEKYSHPGCHIIELYTFVKDPDQHRKMLSGPTHNRSISDNQFATGRTIHDLLYVQAMENDKKIFECSETDKADAYLQRQIAEIL